MKDFLDRLVAQSSVLQDVPRGLVYAVGILLSCSLVLLFVSLFAGEIVWMERRISGRMQARIGPNRVGYQGLLQFLADGLKLLAKEDVIASGADRESLHATTIVSGRCPSAARRRYRSRVAASAPDRKAA